MNGLLNFLLANVTRIEVIGDGGREFVRYQRMTQASLQDEGRTLKLFMTQHPQETESECTNDDGNGSEGTDT